MIGYIKSRVGLHHATLTEFASAADRDRIAAVLRDVQAVPCGATGTVGGELEIAYYTVGREGFRICASDDLSVKIWGSKWIVSEIAKRMAERSG